MKQHLDLSVIYVLTTICTFVTGLVIGMSLF